MTNKFPTTCIRILRNGYGIIWTEVSERISEEI